MFTITVYMLFIRQNVQLGSSLTEEGTHTQVPTLQDTQLLVLMYGIPVDPLPLPLIKRYSYVLYTVADYSYMTIYMTDEILFL